MAVYKNYYNKKYHICNFSTFLCIFLLCSTVTSSIVYSSDRVRHHHSKMTQPQDSEDVDDITDNLAKKTYSFCPNCLHNKQDREVKSDSDKLRLEAIKNQILSKLGLKHKPNITYTLPKEIVLETLFRAQDTDDFFNNYGGFDEEGSTKSEESTERMDFDDFYGRTSEIISFAEQGSRVNQNRLLEFRVSPESSGQVGQEFRVRAATLWLKADVRHHHQVPKTCRSTEIYVFKIISSRLAESLTVSSRQFDSITADPISVTIEENSSGWQKIDLTDTVSKWLAESKKEKLRLFVDCSCCSHWYIHLFNSDKDRKSNPNRPFLVIHTDPNTLKRVRRRAVDCTPDSGNQCCKQRFYVSFKTLGWDDWVIAPQGYYANYCRGDCGHHRTPDTYVSYHTHVIEEVRKTHHLSGMQACCAPLKFSSMSLIYYGPDYNIIKRDLPKMMVDECGCP